MLTKDLLSYRIVSPDIKPRFIDPASPFLLENAADLINIYSPETSRCNRRELAELSAAVIRRSPDMKLASGLNKLLLDGCVFSTPEKEIDHPAVRRESFMKAAAVLKRGDFSAETLRQCAMIPDIYSDLPEFEELISCKRRTPAELLNRYNLAQVQGLLFYATRITLTVKDAPAAELRKLLKAIKFFRLLAHFSSNGKNSLTAEISGPFEIFGPTAKYSMQLANFFPAAVNLPNWKMTAGIKIKGRELTLKLSHKNQLVSHYRNLGGYIPPEVKTFHDLFNEKQDSWQIVGDTPFLDAGNQELVFPDLSIRSADSGNIWHIELFHRWHAALLKKRIALLNADPSLPLLLGIDRALVKDEAEFDGLFENCPHIREKCWLFRDFPGISSTLNVLKKAEKSLQRGK